MREMKSKEKPMAQSLSPQSQPSLGSFDWQDPFRFDAQLTEDERMIRDAAEGYAQDKLLPRVVSATLSERFDREIMNELGALGLLGSTIEGYGCAGVSNVAYGLMVKGEAKASRRAKADEMLALVKLEGYGDRKPAALSGGQRQRVGVARALAGDPGVILMDEPFGAIDAITRTDLQDSLLRLQRKLRKTILFVTHDVDEAILLSDKIFLMSNGPRAKLAEIVTNPLPRDRTRATMHHDPKFYEVRNHLIDFLVHRSKTFAAA